MKIKYTTNKISGEFIYLVNNNFTELGRHPDTGQDLLIPDIDRIYKVVDSILWLNPTRTVNIIQDCNGIKYYVRFDHIEMFKRKYFRPATYPETIQFLKSQS